MWNDKDFFLMWAWFDKKCENIRRNISMKQLAGGLKWFHTALKDLGGESKKNEVGFMCTQHHYYK